MYNYDKNLSSSSSSQDEISLFLRQILLRSSSSAASSSQAHNANAAQENAPHPSSSYSSFPSSSPLRDGKISALGSSPGFLSASGAYGSMKGQSGSAANVSVSENDTDDYDCESEVYHFCSSLKSLELLYLSIYIFVALICLNVEGNVREKG